jgi:uncharacterized paraquat-inducible protein A
MPSKLVTLPPLVHLIILGIGSAAALLATQSLISNSTEKLVTGMASIFIPIAYLVFVAVLHQAHARVTAARITSGEPTTPRLSP